MIENKKEFIQQRRKEIAKRYGSNPHIYSSGKVIDVEQEFPQNLRINIDKKVVETMKNKIEGGNNNEKDIININYYNFYFNWLRI